MPIYQADDYLEHYGRLGMKWYQHIYGEEDGRAKYTEKIRTKETQKMAKGYKSVGKSLTKQGDRAQRKGDTEKLNSIAKRLKKLQTQMKFEKLVINNETFEEFMKDKKEANKVKIGHLSNQLVGGIFLDLLDNSVSLKSGMAINEDEAKTLRRTGQTKLDTQSGTNRAGWATNENSELERWMNGEDVDAIKKKKGGK